MTANSVRVAPATDLDKSDLDLAGVVRVLRRRLWLVLLVAVLAAGAAYVGAKSQTPMYRSSASILLTQTAADTVFDPSSASNPARFVADQIRVLQSQQLTSMVHKLLGYTPSLKVTGASTEDVITITADNQNPRRAATIVNDYATSYVNYRSSSSAALNAAAQAEDKGVLSSAQAQLNQLNAVVASTPVTQQTEVLNAQGTERGPLESQIANADTQLSQLQYQAATNEGDAQVLSPAAVPDLPYAPLTKRDALLGFAIGLMLGIGLAFILDYLDNRIRGKDDLQRSAGNLTVMGMIPVHPEWRDKSDAVAISLVKPDSVAAEAYRSLRTAIQFLGLDRPIHALQVTSPASSEGKTTTLVNLAIALARAGQKVVVVDCDLRRPRVHKFFHLQQEPGFTSVVLGELPLSLALHSIDEVEGLRVLTSGQVPPNPSELLSGNRTSEILDTLRAGYDLVLIDSPPLIPVSDGEVIAARVDATLIVVTDNETRRKQLGRALELLVQVDARVIGTVLNRVGTGRGQYGYKYGNYYQPYVAESVSSNGNGKHADKPPQQSEGTGHARRVGRV